MWQGPNLQDYIVIMILLYDIILNIDPPTITKTQEAWECDLGGVISAGKIVCLLYGWI